MGKAFGGRVDRKGFLKKYMIYFILIIMCVVVGTLNPSFLRVNNAMNILRQVSWYGIMGLGLLQCIILGGIDLSISAALAVAGVVASLLSQDGTAAPLIIAVLAGIASGAVIGCLNGLLITYGNVQAFIATLSTSITFRGIALLLNGGRPVIGLTEQFAVIGSGALLGIPIPAVIWLVFSGIFAVVLRFTSFGRYIYAVGGNEMAAKTSGIKTERIKMLVYTISGIMGAVAGIVLASRVNTASPVAADGYELDSVAGAVIGGASLAGGKGNVIGLMTGVLIIGIIINGMDILNINAYYQQVAKGMIIALSVLLDTKLNRE